MQENNVIKYNKGEYCNAKGGLWREIVGADLLAQHGSTDIHFAMGNMGPLPLLLSLNLNIYCYC